MTVHSSHGATPEPRSLVDSPVLKEVEYKKALFYNRKSATAPGAPAKVSQTQVQNGKKAAKTNSSGWVPVPAKPTHAPTRSSSHAAVRKSPPSSSTSSTNSKSDGAGGNTAKSEPTHVTTSTAAESKNSTGSSSSSNNNITETAASDRIFIPPYKMPFWGMPYGVYSNGGFINPGLFPFVPGGK